MNAMIVGKWSELAWEQNNLARIFLYFFIYFWRVYYWPLNGMRDQQYVICTIYTIEPFCSKGG